VPARVPEGECTRTHAHARTHDRQRTPHRTPMMHPCSLGVSACVRGRMISRVQEFPNKPPVMTFLTKGFWHPNVYKDGKVCISILHEAKADEFNTQEKMSEKWRPILGVEVRGSEDARRQGDAETP
jgi:hypothetical protein